MIDYKKYFKNKRITLMGLGVLGRGIGVAKFLAENGANLLITDLKTKKELAPAIAELKKYKNIRYCLGKHRLEDFRNVDMVVRAPNVPLGSPYLAEAEKNKIPIKMDASLFVELAPYVTTLGITGTRGKSTVTHLLFDIISRFLKETKDERKVYLGGNVRGLATLPLLKKVRAGDIVVMELDSWQLQGFGDSEVSPNIAVFTNLMPDHLNYYKGNPPDIQAGMKRYFADKANIYRHQTEKDFLVVGKTVSALIRKNGRRKSKLVEMDAFNLEWKPKILGEHNRENIQLAATAARLMGVSEEIITKSVNSFKGVPGRLEFLREVKGIKYYNDTTSTMPEATLVALCALSSKPQILNSKQISNSKSQNNKNIILIGGGNDKELDYKKYGEVVPEYVKKLILFPGMATEKIKKSLPASFKKNILKADSMKEALKAAKSVSSEGDIVLLSPGATSFGLFKNEFDRGDQFVEEVKKLK